jgi:hypothetical protein
MDGKLLLRRGGIAGAVLLAVLAFAAAGAYAGDRWHAGFMDSLLRQIQRGELEQLRSEIELLDRGDLARLRERLTEAQSSRILMVCNYAADRSDSNKPFVADEWKVLRRVAVQRHDHPVPPMAGGAGSSDAARTVNERIEACLDEALRRPAE